MLPTVNGEGLPVVPMTEEQKYTFDVKGWILIPGVLSAADCDEIKEHVGRVGDDPQSLDALDRDIWGQPTQKLLDHPVVVGVLNEVLAYEPTASDDSYGFRVDTSGLNRRSCGQDRFNPHGGGGLFKRGWRNLVCFRKPQSGLRPARGDGGSSSSALGTL